MKNSPIQKSIRQLPIFLLAGTLIVLPLVYTEQVLDPVFLPRFGFLLLIFVLIFALLIFFKKSIPFNFSWTKQNRFLYFLSLLYIGLIGLGFVTAVNPTEVYMDFARGITFISGLILFTGFFRANSSHQLLIIKSLVCSTSLIAFLGLYDFYQLQEQLLDNKFQYGIRSLMAHKNLMASALFMGIPMSIYLMIFGKTPWRVLALFNIFISFLLIIIVQSRAVWLALFACIIIGLMGMAYWFYQKQIGFSKNKVFKTSISIIVCVLLGSFLLQKTYLSKINPHNSIKVRLASMFDYKGVPNEHTATITERLALWDNTWKIIKDRPILGVGAGNWKIHFPSKGLVNMRGEQGVVNFQRPHNDFLWIWSEKGLIGLGLWLGFFVYAFVLGILFISRSSSVKESLLVYLSLIGLMGYLIIAFFDFPYERCLHLYYLTIYLSIPIFYGLNREGKDHKKNIGNVVLLFALSIFALMIVSHQMKGEMSLLKALKLRANQQSVAALSQFQKTKNTFYSMDAAAIPIDWYIGEHYYLQKDFQNAQAHFEKAMKLHPFQLNTLNNLGSTYYSIQQQEKAIDYYKRALKIAPHFAESNLNLAAIYFNDKNYELTFKYFFQSRPDLKNVRYAHFLNKIFPIKVNELISKIDNPIVIEKLKELKTTPKWMVNIHEKILENKDLSEEQHILDDVLFVLPTEIGQKEADRLRQKF